MLEITVGFLRIGEVDDCQQESFKNFITKIQSAILLWLDGNSSKTFVRPYPLSQNQAFTLIETNLNLSS